MYKLKKFGFFLFVYFISWQLIIFFLPVRSYLPNSIHIYTLNLLFFISFISAFYIGIYIYSNKPSLPIVKIEPTIKQIYFNAYLSSIFGILGFMFIFYDRVFIRGINYTAGLRAARYQWLRETTGGSLFSIIGNLIIPLAYVSLFILLIYSERLNKGIKLLLVLSSFLGILGHAALNGGRSNLLIAIAVYIVIYFFKTKTKTKTKTNNKFILFSVVIMFSFVIYMTMQSAKMAEISFNDLASLGIESLYGQTTDNFKYFSNDIISLILYIISYLFHGSWTAEALPSIHERPGSYLFYPISVILASLHIMDKPIEIGYFSESGAFISLPGAIFYDFSYTGVVFFSFLLGLFTSYAVYFLITKRVSFVAFGLCLLPLVMVIMAPILPAYGLIYFNFVIYAFVLLGVINSFLFKTRVSWL